LHPVELRVFFARPAMVAAAGDATLWLAVPEQAHAPAAQWFCPDASDALSVQSVVVFVE